MNSTNPHLLDQAEIEEIWGAFARICPRASFLISDVPEGLRQLAVYARYWGASDDSLREAILASTPDVLQRNLKAVVSQFDDLLDAWLAGDEASVSNPSDAYIAYSAMRMSADLIQKRL